MKGKHLVLGVTGSIAAYKAADLIRQFQDKGFDVSVVMTKEAEAFITPLTLSSLSGKDVFRGKLEDEKNSWQMPHIHLAQEADILLIAPATANIIAKLSCGIADDLLTCVVLATKAKIFIASAMNTEMYKNKIVQENCAKLKRLGIEFIDPVEGKLACGTVGDGHLADAEDIVRLVLKKSQ